MSASFGKIDGPIDPKDLGAGVNECVPVSVCAFGEYDDGHTFLQGCGDLFHPARGSGFEIGVGQDAAETIENLDRVGAGVNLKVKEVGDGERKLFEQLIEEAAIGLKKRFGFGVFFNAAPFEHEIGERPG